MTRAPRTALLCVLCLLAAPALANDGFGVIMGTVLSPEERELLGGVEVVLASPALMGGERTTFTDEDGFFWFPQLPPGTYSIRFSSEHFGSLSHQLTVRLNQTHLANVELPHPYFCNYRYLFPESVPLGARRSRYSTVPER
jgi:hypothetical protein